MIHIHRYVHRKLTCFFVYKQCRCGAQKQIKRVYGGA